MTNKAAYLTKIGEIAIQECECPRPRKGELLIRIEYVGVCGSDVHFFNYGKIGRKIIESPFILGHECAGEVVGIGEETKGFELGDKIVMEPGLGCGTCEYCKSGRYNLCPDMKFLASPPNQGTLRQHMVYPARGCFKLPSNVSTMEGAMIEPFAVGLHAAERGEVEYDKTVLIMGMGCIGLMTLLACKVMNAKKIIVSDILSNRLEKAAALGADHTINVSECDIEKEITKLTEGKNIDIVFEAAGRPETTVQAAKLVGRGGVIVQVGNVTDITPYPFIDIMMKEVDIKTVYRYVNIFPKAIALLAAGKVDLKAIEPDVFDFTDTEKAFSYSVSNAKNITKCMIKI